ncbi:NUDIX hydrolase [Paenibacillus sacheonensis]|uniref:NUDIX domain-containing protein n=1 Tax=Paenibacillus sacheonensis TaxID=742054 RepID=A0A7X4YNC2_9BACL|nr:8-oxo-dGTP diphosphatase [Paenibacillus sacheonensis]MBM7565542.1 8-oxo-dGTP diphosphatase [Paenibacillus sacheonensis]NBC69538.1 NUDIX domain-containing protein [Paenibacillus sacheonensis]
MINYNICFIQRKDHILLLNRNFKPWMGCWNGVGGKIEANELPRDSMIREIFEETSIVDYDLFFKGLITWTVNDSHVGGMYLYHAKVKDSLVYETPIRTEEGLLDWKSIPWILDPSNMGLAANLPQSVEIMMKDSHCYEQHCTYAAGKLISLESSRVDPNLETNRELREAYLRKYQLEV